MSQPFEIFLVLYAIVLHVGVFLLNRRLKRLALQIREMRLELRNFSAEL